MKALFFSALLGLGGLIDAATYTVTPSDNWKTRIQTLAAGDTMIFTAGTYEVTGKFGVNFPGTAAAPIVVRGETGAKIVRNGADQNLMDIGTGSYFTIENIDFQGGSKGLRFGETGPISYATIQNNKIHGTETTAVTFNQPNYNYDNIKILGNEIYDTGNTESECLYMGCNQNACTTSNSLIEGNFCHDTLEATSGSLGSGIQVKTGSYNNIIRNNVLVDTRGPGILIYDDYDMGKNLVEGNFIWRSGDHGIQATAGARIINNIVVTAGSGLYGIGILANQPQPNKQPRNVDIAHNTILNPNGIYVGTSNQGSTFNVVNNAIFSTTPLTLNPAGVNNAGNGISGGTATGSNVALGTAAAELSSSSTTSPNPYPAAASKLIKAGIAVSYVTSDFNQIARSNPPTIGAYQYTTATNPGWTLAKAFKQIKNTPVTTATTTKQTPTVPTTPATTDKPAPTDNGGDVPVTALVTVTLQVGPSKLDVQKFASDVAQVLNIPKDAISGIAVDIDQSTSDQSVIHFTLNNALKPDGTRVDPIAAAYTLKALAESNDPVLAGTTYLKNMEVTSVDSSMDVSAAALVQFSVFVSAVLAFFA